MQPVPHADLPALRRWFVPERPGPMLFEHVVATRHGQVFVDSVAAPAVVLVHLTGPNLALRGDPAQLDAIADLAGLVEAPPAWLPALRTLDPATSVWDRLVAVLPDGVPVRARRVDVRLLGPSDAAALAGLEPDIAWIHSTWGGPAGLAAARVARGAFVGGRLASVAVPFYVGAEHEDIGVVTGQAHRARGLSTACAAALVADIRARGRRPSWSTSPDNTASRAVAARLGFRHDRDDVLYAVRSPIPG